MMEELYGCVSNEERHPCLAQPCRARFLVDLLFDAFKWAAEPDREPVVFLGWPEIESSRIQLMRQVTENVPKPPQSSFLGGL
ncbi:unnamed protein product [Schistocephalus solidus]|uniref:Uncharacterized protein n=1 Tax=Schistocephalus solidus TaxID=70667 RepID=A0A183T0C8_SCHSO|nr:unnamed protein product [Schistocephalus solidus]